MEHNTGSRPGKAGLVILIIGLCLTLGSCGPFGYSIHRAVNAGIAAEFPMEPGKPLQTGPMTVDTTRAVQIAVALEVSTDSVQEATGSMDEQFEGRFHFPLRYTVRTPDGRTVLTEQTAVAWDEGSRSIESEDIGPEGGIVALESSFRKFDPPAHGTVNVEATLKPDHRYGAEARRVQLRVYDNVSHHGAWIVAGIAMFMVGGLLTVVGVVVLLAAHSAGPAATVPGTTPALEDEEDPNARNWAMLCHLSALLGYLIPFGQIAGPLIVWLVKRGESPLVDDQGKESLNFQISIVIYSFAGLLLMLVFIGFILLFALAIFHLVMTIVAAVKASDGTRYRYPLTLRLIR